MKKDSKNTDKTKAINYEPLLCAFRLNWFMNNYIESPKLISFLIEKGTKNYAFTPVQIYEGCIEFRKGRTEKDLLETHIDLLGKMVDIGINAHIAGVKLREALLDTAAFNCA